MYIRAFIAVTLINIMAALSAPAHSKSSQQNIEGFDSRPTREIATALGDLGWLACAFSAMGYGSSFSDWASPSNPQHQSPTGSSQVPIACLMAAAIGREDALARGDSTSDFARMQVIGVMVEWAEAGSHRAMYEVGRMIETGRHERVSGTAQSWYRRAADAGSVIAQQRLDQLNPRPSVATARPAQAAPAPAASSRTAAAQPRQPNQAVPPGVRPGQMWGLTTLDYSATGAEELLRRARYSERRNEIRTAAYQGEIYAQTLVSLAYDLGHGEELNSEMSRLFAQAAITNADRSLRRQAHNTEHGRAFNIIAALSENGMANFIRRQDYYISYQHGNAIGAYNYAMEYDDMCDQFRNCGSHNHNDIIQAIHFSARQGYQPALDALAYLDRTRGTRSGAASSGQNCRYENMPGVPGGRQRICS